MLVAILLLVVAVVQRKQASRTCWSDCSLSFFFCCFVSLISHVSQVILQCRQQKLHEVCRLDTGDTTVTNVALHPTERVCIAGIGRESVVVTFDNKTYV